MSGTERGPVDTYEIIWMSGHIETVIAHQVTWPNRAMDLFRPEQPERPSRIQMHAEINGRWVLTLSALEEDIRTVRLVTVPEVIS